MIENSDTNNIICLKCKSSLSLETLSCLYCGEKYLRINSIPILVSDSESYVASMIQNYSGFLKARKCDIKELKEQFKYNAKRRTFSDSLVNAIEDNNLLIDRLLEELIQVASVKKILQTPSFEPNNQVFKDFLYLKRDWCWLTEGEAQVTLIVNALQKTISDHVNQRDNALFLGAGVGRIAAELSRSFQFSYATDLSYSMMSLFSKLVNNETIAFYEINTSNIMNDAHVSRKLFASIRSKEVISDIQNKLCYFVSNALNSPLKDNSLDAIFSIYFTDVLALKLIITEIYRQLKPEGVFIHFGPLGYGFEDVTEKLATNEIKDLFINNGFSVLHETTIDTYHLESDLSMQKTSFKNWLLVVSKQPKAFYSLTINSKVIAPESIHYEIAGDISKDSNFEEGNVTVWLPDGEKYSISLLSFDVLKCCMKYDNLLLVVESIMKLYEVEDDKIIIDIIANLININILRHRSN